MIGIKNKSRLKGLLCLRHNTSFKFSNRNPTLANFVPLHVFIVFYLNKQVVFISVVHDVFGNFCVFIDEVVDCCYIGRYLLS